MNDIFSEYETSYNLCWQFLLLLPKWDMPFKQFHINIKTMLCALVRLHRKFLSVMITSKGFPWNFGKILLFSWLEELNLQNQYIAIKHISYLDTFYMMYCHVSEVPKHLRSWDYEFHLTHTHKIFSFSAHWWILTYIRNLSRLLLATCCYYRL